MPFWEKEWFWKKVVEFIIDLIRSEWKEKDAVEKAAACMGVNTEVIMNILCKMGF